MLLSLRQQLQRDWSHLDAWTLLACQSIHDIEHLIA